MHNAFAVTLASFLLNAALLRQGPFTGRGKDVFRSRKSTTSRAPSMHVDDFVKLGQQVCVTI